MLTTPEDEMIPEASSIKKRVEDLKEEVGSRGGESSLFYTICKFIVTGFHPGVRFFRSKTWANGCGIPMSAKMARELSLNQLLC